MKDFELLLDMLPSDHEAIRSLYELDASGIPCYVLKRVCSGHKEENMEEASHLLLEKMEENDFKQKCEKKYIFNGMDKFL